MALIMSFLWMTFLRQVMRQPCSLMVLWISPSSAFLSVWMHLLNSVLNHSLGFISCVSVFVGVCCCGLMRWRSCCVSVLVRSLGSVSAESRMEGLLKGRYAAVVLSRISPLRLLSCGSCQAPARLLGVEGSIR